MNKILILLVAVLLSCTPKAINPPAMPEKEGAPVDVEKIPQAIQKPTISEPEVNPPPPPAPEPVKSIDFAIIDFDAVYEKAPALQRLRRGLDNYGPAQEYSKLSNSKALSAEDAKRKEILKVVVKSKMLEIEQQCKDLIDQSIGKTGVKYTIIYDIKGRAYVSSEVKESSEVSLNQVNITNLLIELLK